MWTRGMALVIFPVLSIQAESEGWNLAMWGSVIKNGEGRDMDLIAVKWRTTTRRELIDAFLRCGCTLVSTYIGVLYNDSMSFTCSDGVIDVLLPKENGGKDLA